MKGNKATKWESFQVLNPESLIAQKKVSATNVTACCGERVCVHMIALRC